MAKKIIRTGTTADPTGDSLKNAFVKVNDNFTELYNALGLDADTLNIGAFEFTGSVMTTTDSSAIVIDQATTITSNLSVGGDIVPQTANGGDLGSSTLPWRSLYVSNNTIFIGGVPLGIDANGNLTVNSSPVTGGGGGGSTLVNGAYTVSLGSTGTLTFPTLTVPIEDNANPVGTGQVLKFSDSTQQAIIFGPESTVDYPAAQRIIIQGAPGYTGTAGEGGDVYVWAGPGGSVDGNGGDIKVRAGQGNGSGNGGYLNFQAGDTGATGFGGYINIESGSANTAGQGGDITIRARSGGNIDLYTTDSAIRLNTDGGTWSFAADDTLTLPAGGTITEGGGISGAIKLTPSGGANVYQALLIYPTAGGEGDHIHLTAAGGTTELYLGSDNHYVKLASGGVVRIQADNGVNSSAAWTFGTNGAITTTDAFTVNVPDGVPNSVSNWVGGGGWNNPPYSNLATTGGTGTGLTVNVSAADGGYININYITIATAGTGYTAGDVITITNENNIPGTFTIGVSGNNSWQLAGGLKFPDNTVQTTAAESFSFSVAADDSTQRAISNNELIKFIGAGGVTTASDAEGNITITGSGGGSSIPAVVTTGAVGVDGAAHAKVQFTVTSATTVTAVGVTAIGVTDSTKGTITLSGSPATGSFDIVAVTNTYPGEFYIFIPFATNASGTGYGAPISGEGTNPCLVRGTMITMADMSRVAVENITYSDDILVWDFDLGEFASAKPVWIKKTQTTVVSCLLTFSDHSELRIVGDSPKAHRIFNKEAGKFTYGSMPETPIGTTTFNDQGEEITLISKEWIVGEVEFYNVMTDYHMNLFANSILTSMRYNNLYPITDMKFVKDSRTLRTADDYPNVEERLYKGFRLAEQTQSVEEIETHIQWLLTLEVEKETECV